MYEIKIFTGFSSKTIVVDSKEEAERKYNFYAKEGMFPSQPKKLFIILRLLLLKNAFSSKRREKITVFSGFCGIKNKTRIL
mgnify:CR=1 FL=1